jgi:hypothetical protein
MSSKMPELITMPLRETTVLDALDSMPADLRRTLGWSRLFELTLDAVLAADTRAATGNSQMPVLLTLTTYCYAANVLCSEDIEAACFGEADVAFITSGSAIWAAEVRQFRRNHRALIESCLCQVFMAALIEASEGQALNPWAASALAAGVGEFAHRRLNLAILFDTAMSE